MSTELPVAGLDLATEPGQKRTEHEVMEYPVDVKAAARFLGVSPR